MEPCHITTHITDEFNETGAAVGAAGEIPCVDVNGYFHRMGEWRHILAKGYPNVRVKTNRGVLVKTLGGVWDGEDEATLRNVTGLRAPFAMGCILRFLLRPKPEIWAMVHDVVGAMREEGTVTVGIHLRFDDRKVWTGFYGESGAKQLDDARMEEFLNVSAPYWSCVQNLEDYWLPPSVTTKWLLLTNSEAFKTRFKEMHPDKVLTTPVAPVHSHSIGYELMHNDTASAAALQQQYRETVAEWLLLALCDLFVIGESGYSRTAAFYSLRAGNIFHRGCDPETPAKLTDLASTWSGI